MSISWKALKFACAVKLNLFPIKFGLRYQSCLILYSKNSGIWPPADPKGPPFGAF